jgi:hypothetical protein
MVRTEKDFFTSIESSGLRDRIQPEVKKTKSMLVIQETHQTSKGGVVLLMIWVTLTVVI